MRALDLTLSSGAQAHRAAPTPSFGRSCESQRTCCRRFRGPAGCCGGPLVDRNATIADRKALLDPIHSAFGATPNMFRAVANSPVALKSLLAAIGALSGDVQALRTVGFGDEEIVEILAHVALNLFTNYVNVALAVPVDFPAVKLRRAA